MPNYKKLAKPYEQRAIDALKVFVSKKSVYEEDSVQEGAPFGKGVKSALDYLAKLGKDYGFRVDKCDGYVTELTVGEEGPIVGVYAHADVVPATGKWSTKDPFSAEIVGEKKEAKMIARGTSDDKGPLLAAFFAMKALKDNHLIEGYRVRLCAGGDEERGSSCLRHYFEDLKKEHCALGFTPDADFPLIYAEKGMAKKTYLEQNVDLSPIIAMDGGVVANAVNDKLMVTLPFDPSLEKAFADARLDGEIRKEAGFMIAIFRGVTAHGSTRKRATTPPSRPSPSSASITASPSSRTFPRPSPIAAAPRLAAIPSRRNSGAAPSTTASSPTNRTSIASASPSITVTGKKRTRGRPSTASPRKRA